jgi:hypothetical protein
VIFHLQDSSVSWWLVAAVGMWESNQPPLFWRLSLERILPYTKEGVSSSIFDVSRTMAIEERTDRTWANKRHIFSEERLV